MTRLLLLSRSPGGTVVSPVRKNRPRKKALMTLLWRRLSVTPAKFLCWVRAQSVLWCRCEYSLYTAPFLGIMCPIMSQALRLRTAHGMLTDLRQVGRILGGQFGRPRLRRIVISLKCIGVSVRSRCSTLSTAQSLPLFDR